jgi:hypothetical protein
MNVTWAHQPFQLQQYQHLTYLRMFNILPKVHKRFFHTTTIHPKKYIYFHIESFKHWNHPPPPKHTHTHTMADNVSKYRNFAAITAIPLLGPLDRTVSNVYSHVQVP